MTRSVRNVSMLAGAALFGVVAFAAPAHADDVDYNVSINPSINMTIPAGDIVLNVDPTSQPFDSGSTTILVSTNNSFGYHLLMTAPSTNLVKTDDSYTVIPTLDALDGGYTETSFVANKWGYKIGEGNYQPFATNATIKETDTVAESDPTNFTIAAKVDFHQTAGVYDTVITFTAVANLLPVYMQDLDDSICPEDVPLKVIDIRDSEQYLVQRLADGKCWMLDNLRLDPTQVSLDSLKGNTNASDETLGYLKNGGGSTPYAVAGVSSTWPSSGYSYDTRYVNPFAIADYRDTVSAVTHGQGSGKIGMYYNLCAVSAGSYCYPGSDEANDVKSDICPSGWRLPIGGKTTDADNEFNNLYLTYNSNPEDFMTALSLPFTGRLVGLFESQDNSGYLWSSTSVGNAVNQNYGLSASNSFISPGTTLYRDYAFTARCIRDPRTLDDITYMQDIKSTVIKNTAIGSNKTLIDKRDNEEYLVGKLADGNLWMLDNLRLDVASLSRDDLAKGTNVDSNAYCLKSGGCYRAEYGQYGAASPVAAKTADGGTWEDSYDKPYIATGYKDTVAPVAYGDGSGKIGIYYNYCAASAGTYCYAENEGIGNAIYDVCPSAWRLPRGGDTSNTTSEFNNLYLAYDSDQMTFTTALSIPISGYFRGFVLDQSTIATFWSSTFASGASMYDYDLFVNSSYVGPDFIGRINGFSIRCISTF